MGNFDYTTIAGPLLWHGSNPFVGEALIEIGQCPLQHLSVAGVLRSLQLLQDLCLRQHQFLSPLSTPNLFRGKLFLSNLGLCREFLLLFNRLTLPSTGHNSII